MDRMVVLTGELNGMSFQHGSRLRNRRAVPDEEGLAQIR